MNVWVSKIIRKLARIFSRIIFGPDFMTFHLLKDDERLAFSSAENFKLHSSLRFSKKIFNNGKMVWWYDKDWD